MWGNRCAALASALGSLLLCATLAHAGPMSLPGSFAVSPTGAATYTVPIEVPPGAAGLAPKLSLNYNSQAGNGLLGMGWSVSGLSMVTRCARTMAQDGVRGGVNFDANDRFCLDGQRLVLVAGTYGADGAQYRTEQESFSKIVSYGSAGNGPAWFKIWAKSGQILEYGNSADSLIEAQGKSAARVWALNKVSDRRGNYMSFSYAEDNASGEFLPKQIDYTGNATGGSAGSALLPASSVKFLYESRPDLGAFYQAGSLVKSTQRLKEIQTYNGADLVADYKATYQTSASTQRTLLKSLTRTDAQGNSVSTELAWTAGGGQTYTQFAQSVSANFGAPPSSEWLPIIGDFNADGKSDFAFVTSGSGGSWIMSFLSKGDGSFAQNSQTLSENFGTPPHANWQPLTGDFNGDGRTDFALFSGNQLYSFRSNGDGTFTRTAQSLGSTNYGSPPQASWTPITGDFNGDGRIDLVLVTSGANGTTVYANLSNGDGTFTPVGQVAHASWNFGAAPDKNYTPITGDFNGDGQTDFALVGGNTVFVFTGKGDGTFAPNAQTLNGSFGNPPSANWTPITGDFNVDGKTDFALVISSASGTTVYTCLSKGDGTFAEVSNVASTTWNFGGPPDKGYTPVMGDFNGDGKGDFAFVGGNILYLFTSKGDGTFITSAQSLGTNFGNPPSAAWTLVTGDFSGDGKTDFLFVSSSQLTGYLSDGVPSEAVSSISAPGNVILAAPTYATLPQLGGTRYYREFFGAYPQMTLSPAIAVVKDVDLNNGVGGLRRLSYSYGTALVELGTGRGFLGFNWTQMLDTATGISTRTAYRQDWPYVGQPKQQVKSLAGYGNAGTLSLTQNDYACQDPDTGTACTVAPGKRYFTYAAQTVQASWDLNGSALPLQRSTSAYDNWGNATTLAQDTSDGFNKTVTNTYLNDTTAWLLGQLTKTVTSNTTGATTTIAAPSDASTPPTDLAGTGAGNSQAVFSFNQTISANTNQYNLRAAAVAAGWNQTAPLIATVTVNGVWVYSDNAAVPAFDTGAGFPAGSSLKLNNYGGIVGKGGNGGAGIGAAGENGGDALRISYPISINNLGGIYAGGGGGGGGGTGYEHEVYYTTEYPSYRNIKHETTYAFNGSGGGGGAGWGANGGAPGPFNAWNTTSDYYYGTKGFTAPSSAYPGWGAAGALSGGGGPGVRGSVQNVAQNKYGPSTTSTIYTSSGGAGGTFGQAGGAGSSGSNQENFSWATGGAGGPGGAGGRAIVTNGNAISWVAGNDATHVQGAIQ